jgi:hypothetical protein
MTAINLTYQQVENLTREEIKNLLKKNPNFKDLKDEYQGKFHCIYSVNGIEVFVFNEVGGYVTTYLSNPDLIARAFAIKSYLVLNDISTTNF